MAFRTASSRPEGHGSGPGVRLRHPAGLLAEYLEHRPSADADEPEPVFRWPQRSPPGGDVRRTSAPAIANQGTVS